MPIDWTKTGVVVAGIALIVTPIGWFVAHSLDKSREKTNRRERFNRAVADLEFSINRISRAIADKDNQLPWGWTVTTMGPLDLRAKALKGIRLSSVKEMEPYVMVIRTFMNSDCRGRFDREWEKYQDYKIEGVEGKDPATGQEFTSHIECKKGLIECLEQMKKIAAEIEV